MSNNTGYPSIDKPWLRYFRDEDLKAILPTCTVYKSVYENNKDFSKNYAINYMGNKISYARLFEKVDACTRSLLSIGVKRGECISLLTAGVPESIYIVLACSRIGAIANFINPLFNKEQMVERINDTEADWLFVLDEMYTFIEGHIDDTCIKNVVVIPVTNSFNPVLAKALFIKSKARSILKSEHSINYYSYNEFIRNGRKYDGKLDLDYEDNTSVVMVYSSGTTGASKGILLTNESVNAIIQNYRRDTFYGKRTDTFLAMIPVWFSTGIVLSLIMPLAHGVCVIPEIQFSKESFARDLMKYKPSLTLTATSLWIYVATSDKTKDIDLSQMIYPSTGGEKISEKDEILLNRFLKEHGCQVNLLKGYGMCELGSEITGTTAADGYSAKIGSTGYPILNAIVSAFNIDNNEELKYNEHGEIRACTPAHMKGYYKNPDATAKFFKTDKEGRVWGCTGDIGYVDEDGEVFILGRATDCYKSKEGKTVYLFDIEDIVLQEKSVAQCKVVDIIEDNETKLVAHIVFIDGTNNKDDIIKKISTRLSKELPENMNPDYFKIRSSMPVHSNGKRDVGALREDRQDLIKV